MQPEHPGAFGEMPVVADVHADPADRGLEDGIAQVPGAEVVLLPEALDVRDVRLAVLAQVRPVGIEPLGDDDFYGQSYFCDPRGQFIGEVGSANDEELLVRDMDLDKIQEVRQTWQFYRDRRPDAYGDLVRP